MAQLRDEDEQIVAFAQNLCVGRMCRPRRALLGLIMNIDIGFGAPACGQC